MTDQQILYVAVAYPFIGLLAYLFIFWKLFREKWFRAKDVFQLVVIIFVFGIGSSFFLLGWPILAPIFYLSEVSAKSEAEKWKKEQSMKKESKYHGMSVEEMMRKLNAEVGDPSTKKTNK